TGDQIVKGALVGTERRHREAEGEEGARNEVSQVPKERRADGRHPAVTTDYANSDHQLADRLAAEGMQHGRVGGREHDEREEGGDRLERGDALRVRADDLRADEPERELYETEHGEIDQRRDYADPEAGGASRNHGAYNIVMISVRDGQNQILAQISGPTPPELPAVTRAPQRVLPDHLPPPLALPPPHQPALH